MLIQKSVLNQKNLSVEKEIYWLKGTKEDK